jgi:hypothetical protein
MVEDLGEEGPVIYLLEIVEKATKSVNSFPKTKR